MLAGYLLAVLVGVIFGMLIGLNKTFYDSVIVLVDFFRSIPVTALYPVFVLFFGIGHSSKIFMVFWACLLIIILNSAYGVIQSKKLRVDMARLYGANKFQTFKWITFFDALPQTMIGLRVGISYALIVEILTEMFMGSKFGLGQRITDSYTRYSMDELFAFIFITGFIGYLFNTLFVKVERKLTFWII
jgi:NitT/TauT family transport system permease protein